MSIVGDLAAFSNPFGAPAKGKWNLTPAVWIDSVTLVQTTFFYENRAADGADEKNAKGAFTAIDQITDSGGRRLAKYEYPYLDGQKVKDLGRKAETYTFNVRFHGPNYQQKLKEFRNNIYLPGHRGTLTHPVMNAIRGAVSCRLETFEPIHRADEWNAVTFRAVFIEDNSALLDSNASSNTDSPETALQKALQSLVAGNAAISLAIGSAAGILATPAAIVAGLHQRNASISGQISGLLGGLASTFSSLGPSIFAIAAAVGLPAGVASLSDGTVTSRLPSGSSQTSNVPPAFQVGLDPTTADFLSNHVDNFVDANQVTVTQAVFQANQTRSSITAAIAEVEANLGNEGYDIVVLYRTMAVTVQEVVEACITSAQAQVKIYLVPRPMSLRTIAFECGLSPDRQNDIEALNPYLGSVNYVPRGSKITVPAS